MLACLFALAVSEFAVPIASYLDDFVSCCEEVEAKSVVGCLTDWPFQTSWLEICRIGW